MNELEKVRGMLITAEKQELVMVKWMFKEIFIQFSSFILFH